MPRTKSPPKTVEDLLRDQTYRLDGGTPQDVKNGLELAAYLEDRKGRDNAGYRNCGRMVLANKKGYYFGVEDERWYRVS